MGDPTDRRGGAWPGDRPTRWGGVVGNLVRFVVTTGAAIVQLVLVVPVYVVASGGAGDALGGWAGPLLTLVWGGATLWAAWAWIFLRSRIVLAPLVTLAAIAVVAGLG